MPVSKPQRKSGPSGLFARIRTKCYKDRMAQLNISIPPSLRQWIDHRIAEGRYSSASDYVRDLVRRDQEAADEETEWLRGLIAEGLASGISPQKPETIIENIISGRRAKRG